MSEDRHRGSIEYYSVNAGALEVWTHDVIIPLRWSARFTVVLLPLDSMLQKYFPCIELTDPS